MLQSIKTKPRGRTGVSCGTQLMRLENFRGKDAAPIWQVHQDPTESLLVVPRVFRQIRLFAGLFDCSSQPWADAPYVLDRGKKSLAKHEVRGTNAHTVSELPIRLGIALITKREPVREALKALCFSRGDSSTSWTED